MLMYCSTVSLAEFRFSQLEELQVEAIACDLRQRIAAADPEDVGRLVADERACAEALALFDRHIVAGTLDQAKREIATRLPPPPAAPDLDENDRQFLQAADALFAAKDPVTSAAMSTLAETGWCLQHARPVVAAMAAPPGAGGRPHKNPPWLDWHDHLCELRLRTAAGQAKHPAARAIVLAAKPRGGDNSAAKNLVARWDKKMALRTPVMTPRS
jgi:hypothetical protein